MKKLKISSEQKQIIIGKLLGDGHMETVNGKTFCLKIEHSLKQKEYVDWLYGKLENLAASPPRSKTQTVNGKEYGKYWFNTSYSSSFRFYYHQFYQDKKKVAPPVIKRLLTPLALAIWFMDDGSIKSRFHKAKIINTQSFDRISLKRLRNALELNFNLKTALRNQAEGKQIYILGSEADKFKTIIGKYILPSFIYKLG